MIEIRIPKEIKNYREKLFFGLNLRQCVCAASALLVCVPLYIFGSRFLPREAVSWAVVAIAAPLMLIGFFRFNDMSFEQFIAEYISFHFHTQKRVYEYEPLYMELRRMYLEEEYLDESGKKSRREQHLITKNEDL